jgi:hypothetical protein
MAVTSEAVVAGRFRGTPMSRLWTTTSTRAEGVRQAPSRAGEAGGGGQLGDVVATEEGEHGPRGPS